MILQWVESKDEVAEEPGYEEWHAEKDPEKFWQAIIKMHKIDCDINVTVINKLAGKKAYQNIKQGSFETLMQNSERFRDTYKGYGMGTAEWPVSC